MNKDKKQKGRYKASYVSSTTTEIFSAGPNGTKILSIVTPFAVTGTLTLQISNGDDSYAFYSDNTITANKDLLALTKFPVDENGQKYFLLEPGWVMTGQFSGTNCNVFIYGEDY